MEASFTADIQAPGAARRVLATLAADLGDDLLERSGLALTEVVANSVEHAGLTQTDEIHLHVSLCPELLRIEVLDDGPGFIAAPVASKPDKAPHGWGLYVVDRLTDRWGVDRSHGTRVWLEFDRDAVGAANRSAAGRGRAPTGEPLAGSPVVRSAQAGV